MLAVPLMANIAGCYDYRPFVGTAPRPGQGIAVEVTDRGRLDLADQLGAGVLRVEGTLIGSQDDGYLMGVSRVRYISGQVSNWSGERVRVPLADVSHVTERALSQTRTWLAVGTAVLAIGAFIVTRTITGKASPPGDEKTPPGGGT